jgi:lipopolysaccharide/colanic/teichoic acid biosynthesis glycosyltransferase
MLLSILTLPIVLFLVVGSAVAFRANPFFVQRRFGRNGRPYRIAKIRTLPKQAPRYANRVEITNVQTSKWGLFLRRTKLDELPQLWLVVVGKMSLVGPRPMIPSIVDLFDARFASTRASVRPGCTGVWQLSPAADDLVHEAPEYDYFYVQNMSLTLDLYILGRTVLKVLGAKWVFTLDDARPTNSGGWGNIPLIHDPVAPADIPVLAATRGGSIVPPDSFVAAAHFAREHDVISVGEVIATATTAAA